MAVRHDDEVQRCKGICQREPTAGGDLWSRRLWECHIGMVCGQRHVDSFHERHQLLADRSHLQFRVNGVGQLDSGRVWPWALADSGATGRDHCLRGNGMEIGGGDRLYGSVRHSRQRQAAADGGRAHGKSFKRDVILCACGLERRSGQHAHGEACCGQHERQQQQLSQSYFSVCANSGVVGLYGKRKGG